MRILLYVALAFAVLASDVAATAESDQAQLSMAVLDSSIAVVQAPKRFLRKHEATEYASAGEERVKTSALSKLATELKSRNVATKKLLVATKKMKAAADLKKFVPKASITNNNFLRFLNNGWDPKKAKALGKLKTDADFKKYEIFFKALGGKKKAAA